MRTITCLELRKVAVYFPHELINTHLAMCSVAYHVATHSGWVVDVLGKQYEVYGHLDQSISID